MSYTHLSLVLVVCMALAGWTEADDKASAGETAGVTQASQLTGHWSLAETDEEKEQRAEAIDQATRNMRPAMKRSRARGRLTERTSPPPTLILEVDDTMVTLGAGERAIELELGGAPIEVSAEASGTNGKAQLSAKREGESLIVMAEAGNGGRTTTYSANGDSLTMEVSMSGNQLPAPIEYVTTYAREK
jgi:hypothetical protein